MKNIYLLAALTFALTACDSNIDNPDNPSQIPARVIATIGESVSSRASDQDWTAGDCIGITIKVKGEDEMFPTPHTNVPYTTLDGNNVFTGEPLFFYWPMEVTAYYPFTGEDGTTPGDDGIISTHTRIENQTTNQPRIDFLFATGQTTIEENKPTVKFTFDHKMSKLTFIFESSDPVIINGIQRTKGVDVSQMVRYSLEGLVLDGSFDTKTGVCAANSGDDATLTELIINLKDEDFFKPEYTYDQKDEKKVLSARVAPLILLPQTPGVVTLHVYTDELEGDGAPLQHYTCALSFNDNMIKPGVHYIYKVKVTQMGLMVDNMSINPWAGEDDEARSFTATIDGDPAFKK